jgi:molecular chaperone GrpE
MAMACVPKEIEKEQWIAGFKHIQKQFEDFMQKNGIEKIKAEGEKFNTERHESIGAQDSDTGADMVLKQVRPGYMLNGKVLRPAQVIISTEKNLKNSSPL